MHDSLTLRSLLTNLFINFFLGFSSQAGSEGRLAFPYQRIGMINALLELSNAPEGKYLNSLARTVCGFLLTYYKDEGNLF